MGPTMQTDRHLYYFFLMTMPGAPIPRENILATQHILAYQLRMELDEG